ncbi:MAG: hypothetical protein AAGA86_15215, partial [Bacteroidota bacterium]
MKQRILSAICSFTTVFGLTQQEPVSTLQTEKELHDKLVTLRCHATIDDSKTPLFIVDGVPTAADDQIFKELDSKKIRSVKLLKDPVSWACYSSAAKNGVILITT